MDTQALILHAQRLGFAVVENDDSTGWLVIVPARQRHPSTTLGDFRSSVSAWRVAAMLCGQPPFTP